MSEKKVTGWFTVNGKHIPIFEGEGKKDVVKRIRTTPKLKNSKFNTPEPKKEYDLGGNLLGKDGKLAKNMTEKELKDWQAEERNKQLNKYKQTANKKIEPIDKQIREVRFWSNDIPDGMYEFDVETANGKQKIYTNYGSAKYPKYNASITKQWDKYYTVNGKNTVREIFKDAIDNGYNEIRLSEAPTAVRGFHNLYVSARKKRDKED